MQDNTQNTQYTTTTQNLPPTNSTDTSLKTSRTKRPLLTLSVLVFCLYLWINLFPDLMFSFQNKTPFHFRSVAELLDSSKNNSFLTLDAKPDRSLVAQILSGKKTKGEFYLVPFLDSNSKIWLHQAIYDPKPVSKTPPREQYTGRLRYLRDLPFHEPLQRYVHNRNNLNLSEDTLVLLDEQHPVDYWYVPFFFVLLILLALYFILPWFPKIRTKTS